MDTFPGSALSRNDTLLVRQPGGLGLRLASEKQTPAARAGKAAENLSDSRGPSGTLVLFNGLYRKPVMGLS